jgi:hypothetical protein
MQEAACGLTTPGAKPGASCRRRLALGGDNRFSAGRVCGGAGGAGEVDIPRAGTAPRKKKGRDMPDLPHNRLDNHCRYIRGQ